MNLIRLAQPKSKFFSLTGSIGLVCKSVCVYICPAPQTLPHEMRFDRQNLCVNAFVCKRVCVCKSVCV